MKRGRGGKEGEEGNRTKKKERNSNSIEMHNTENIPPKTKVNIFLFLLLQKMQK
jgi:hypothetical protein